MTLNAHQRVALRLNPIRLLINKNMLPLKTQKNYMKPKKKIILLVSVMFASIMVQAQAFDDGKNIISLGFGFPATSTIQNSFDPYKNFVDYKFKNYGTVVLKYEHGLAKYFGMGINFDYSAASISYKYGPNSSLLYQYNIASKLLSFYARLNGHFPIGNKLDIYGGVGLGYYYQLNTNSDSNPTVTTTSHRTTVLDFDYQLTIGARYMIKDHFGFFFEVGHANTMAQAGVAFGF